MGPVAPYGTPSADQQWLQTGEWWTLVDEKKGLPNDAGYVRVAEHVVQDMRTLTAPAT